MHNEFIMGIMETTKYTSYTPPPGVTLCFPMMELARHIAFLRKYHIDESDPERYNAAVKELKDLEQLSIDMVFHCPTLKYNKKVLTGIGK